MECKVGEIGTWNEHKFVVILSKYQNKILLSRHRDRQTWETQGGHIEAGESALEAARRELWEESGALRYTIEQLCEYWAGDQEGGASGCVFLAEIEELGPIPEVELHMVEVRSFDTLPPNLTYPGITPHLFKRAKHYFGLEMKTL